MNDKTKNIIDFTTLFESHKNRVFNTVLSLLQNQHEAEDVTQEVFIRIFETLPQFKGESNISTWVYRIAINKSLDFLKAKKAKKRSAFLISIFGEKEDYKPIEIPDFVHPGIALERKEQAQELFGAINALPENQKIAFTLNKIEGLSYAEIAEVMQTSTSSVESLLFRAKQGLQKSLKDFYQNEILK